MFTRSGILAIIAAPALLASASALAVPTVSMDFLNPGSPVVGSTTINTVGLTVLGGPGSQTAKGQVCVDVITLCGAAAVADARLNFANGANFDVDRFLPGQSVTDDPESVLNFTFNKRVQEITLDIARLAPGEIIEAGPVGTPTLITGGLTLHANGKSILAAASGDLNKGSVTWSGLNTLTFDLYYGTQGVGNGAIPGSGSVVGVGVEPVPVPAALPLMAGALALVGVTAARRRSA